ncbi:hypothetical protein ABZ606_03890 [Streptomyces sp. NPDC012461]|jgi:hypothetical protein|uniref:Uncharacterized protein n=2 Tax=unclassified Streptomyces TaxID=2593676 RepID=A0A6G3QZM7_9ACTN|nr:MULTISPECIES: hypothetical protein [unclassified Streptomyces]MBM7089491.1 hypothetical protein [Streptomyces sp. S12]NEA88637.1 hypothetical protein [Streptomyces sp. SID14436]NEC83098.1 hypothetical protein [Streptomyces sp. SID7958]NED19231.1 hypothetical protein [Streptomyces sp. SID9913]
MTNLKVRTTAQADFEGDLASLRGDCARMAPHWAVPDRGAPRPVSPSLIHGVSVPTSSARLLDAMSEYGD